MDKTQFGSVGSIYSLHPQLTHIGTDRTLERGAVNVFRDEGLIDHPIYVTAVDAPLSVDGCPMGLREAPIDILLAARGYSVADGASEDFKPIIDDAPLPFVSALRKFHTFTFS